MPDQPLPFRLDIRVRNNRLIKARERLGYKSAPEAAQACGISYTTLNHLEGFKISPLQTDGTWTESALKLAEFLYEDPAELWPKEALFVQKSRASVEASFEDIRRLSGDPPEMRMMIEADHGTRTKLLAAMSALSPQQKEVIEARFAGDNTLDEVGAEMGLSRERVRQIENSALTKLRKVIGRDDAICGDLRDSLE
jgi:RNA polymerase sigma factor (sigma-70 family)